MGRFIMAYKVTPARRGYFVLYVSLRRFYTVVMFTIEFMLCYNNRSH